MKTVRLTISWLALCGLLIAARGAAASPVQQPNTPPPQSEQKPTFKVITKVDPVYPEEAERAGVYGKVVVSVKVETTGEVSLVQVVSGHRLLNQAAIEAAKQWKFINTYPDPVTIELTFNFSQYDDPAQEPARAEPDKSQADQTPAVQLTHKVDAVYPAAAKRKGIEGDVVLEVTVTDKGEVADARTKSGAAELRQAAIDAVKQFRFTNNRKAPVLITLTIRFALGDKDKGAPKKPQG